MRQMTMGQLLGLLLLLFGASAAHAQEPAVRPMQQSDSYTYSVDALRGVLTDASVYTFRVHMAWGEDDTLQGALVAIDEDGQTLATTPATFVDRAIDLGRLNAMDDIAAEVINAQPPALAMHILQPREAATLIANWATLRHSGAPLAPALSQEGQPLRYHTIDKAMIADIVGRAETAELVVFWGLNADGKLTPVLMGIDQDDAEMVGSVAAAGFVMDFTQPCPATCCDGKCGKLTGVGPPGGVSP